MNHYPKATFINMLTITIGSLIGLWFKQFFTEDLQEILFQALGLGTLFIGIKMSLRLPDGYLLVFMFSLILGGLMGQMIGVDLIIASFSEVLKNSIGNTENSFSEGLISAFLLFCVGSMTIVGAIEEGLKGNRELLYVKSLLDGFSSIALASVFGIGVLFSIIPLLIFQGGMTLLATRLSRILNPVVIDCISAVGGVLIIGIAFDLLKMASLRLENLLPSLIVVVLLSAIYHKYIEKKEEAFKLPN